jgi:hypothetical protein
MPGHDPGTVDAVHRSIGMNMKINLQHTGLLAAEDDPSRVRQRKGGVVIPLTGDTHTALPASPGRLLHYFYTNHAIVKKYGHDFIGSLYNSLSDKLNRVRMVWEEAGKGSLRRKIGVCAGVNR